MPRPGSAHHRADTPGCWCCVLSTAPHRSATAATGIPTCLIRWRSGGRGPGSVLFRRTRRRGRVCQPSRRSPQGRRYRGHAHSAAGQRARRTPSMGFLRGRLGNPAQQSRRPRWRDSLAGCRGPCVRWHRWRIPGRQSSVWPGRFRCSRAYSERGRSRQVLIRRSSRRRLQFRDRPPERTSRHWGDYPPRRRGPSHRGATSTSLPSWHRSCLARHSNCWQQDRRSLSGCP